MPNSSVPSRALARRLAQLRASRPGLTQQGLAAVFSTETGKEVSAPTVSTWESMRAPKVPTDARLDAYARLFATSRSFESEPPRLLTPKEIAQDETASTRHRDLLAELHRLRDLDAAEPEPEVPQRTLLQFDEGDVVIVCPEAPPQERGPLADPASPNFTKLHQYADTDALLEVFGHLRALNPRRKIFYRIAGSYVRGELQNHLILIGGVGWSRTTRVILDRLDGFPVSQIEHPDLATGDVFQIPDPDSGTPRVFFPTTNKETGDLIEDVGLIARVRNPFNSGRTVTLLNGIHSRGVIGAALAVTDETIRTGNQEYLAQRFPSGSFAMLVRVSIVEGDVMAPDFHDEHIRLFEWSPGEGED